MSEPCHFSRACVQAGRDLGQAGAGWEGGPRRGGAGMWGALGGGGQQGEAVCGAETRGRR